MLIRATNGNEITIFPTDHISLKIYKEKDRPARLKLYIPNIMTLTIHCSGDISELNWLSDTLAAARLAGREYFDAAEELKKFRPNDPESITKTNAYRIFKLAKELRYSDCNEEEIYELTDEMIRLTGICPQCDGMGGIPEEHGMTDCTQCGGKGFILPRPSLEDEYGEMPF